MDIIYRYDPFARLVPQRSVSPDESIRRLEDGHARYRTIVAQVEKEIVAGSQQDQVIIVSSPLSLGFSAKGAPLQIPHALVLGCSDARVPIERIFDQGPNELFVIRVAGNVLGTECLGSIDYAVQNLKQSLQLLVVLGHSGCGAATAAVDTYLSPQDYPEVGFTHALRSLVDRLQIAVRGAAKAIERVCGDGVREQPDYRNALVEATVYLNAALTAFDVRREIAVLGASSVRVVYGVFNLDDQKVHPLPHHDHDEGSPTFGEVPTTPDQFIGLGEQFVKALQSRGLLEKPRKGAAASRRRRSAD
jgi:carbonic anhydrase